MTTLTPLKGSLMPSESLDRSRGVDYVQNMFKRYNVRNYAVLVDHTSVAEDLEGIDASGCAGYFSFDLLMEGDKFNGEPVNLITLDEHIPECDGWLILSTSRGAVIGLNKALVNQNKAHQVIIRIYPSQTTQITAYMDVFSGDTETVQYINHYYNRTYRIVSPIDLRYIICTPEGEIVRSGQRIILPGGLTVFDTRKMGLGYFKGYMRIFLEVENFQVRVQPFLHYWADYISSAGMTRNHQSGWAAHPPNSVFSLSYIPTHPNLELMTSFFNEGSSPIKPKMMLRYKQDGVEKKVEKYADEVLPGQMSYQNISKLFSEIEVSRLNSTYLLVTCDKEMHRPNHYIMVKGTHKCVDTFHDTKCAGKHIARKTQDHYFTQDQLDRMRSRNMNYGILPYPILDNRYGIETYIGLVSGSISDVSDYDYHVRNDSGEIIHQGRMSFYEDSPQFLNLNEFLRNEKISIGSCGGSICLIPDCQKNMPNDIPFFMGLKHQKGQHISTSFQGSSRHGNLPFYMRRFNRPLSREYRFSPVQANLVFGNGILDHDYDSFFLFSNASLMQNYHKVCEYRIEILDRNGRLYAINRKIKPFCWDFFFISELIEEMGLALDDPYFTIWSNSYDTKIPNYQGLYSKNDHSISVDDMSQGTLMEEPQV